MVPAVRRERLPSIGTAPLDCNAEQDGPGAKGDDAGSQVYEPKPGGNCQDSGGFENHGEGTAFHCAIPLSKGEKYIPAGLGGLVKCDRGCD